VAQLGDSIPSGTCTGETFVAAVQEGAGNAKAEFASEYCPRCSARLAARSCKMICPGCGYYMSCSDFY
jgi:hypothetical protein